MSGTKSEKITTWGQALKHLRVKAKLPFRDIVDTIKKGVNADDVRAWEDGKAVPTTYQMKGLYAMMPALRHYSRLLPEAYVNDTLDNLDMRAKLAEDAHRVAKARGEEHPAFAITVPWLPPGDEGQPTPPEVSAPPPPPTDFGEALALLRLREGLNQWELAELIGVAQGTISRWEISVDQPVEENYAKLLGLLPGLSMMPQPACRAIAKPSGNPLGLSGPRTDAWRERVITRLHEGEIHIDTLHGEALALFESADTTARSASEYLDDIIEWATYLKGALPSRVATKALVDLMESYPSIVSPAPQISVDVLPPMDVLSPPDPMPQLPGLAGAGVRYAYALHQLVGLAEEVFKHLAALSAAKLRHEAATREVGAAHDELDKAARK